MKKRILSLVLALSMMISLFPVSALAQTPGGGTAVLAEENGEMKGTVTIENGVPTTEGGENWTYEDSMLTLNSGTYNFSGKTVTCDVIIYNGATVVGGTFEGTVWNEAGGKISGGTFADVSNRGTIIGGTFTGAHGSIINHTTIAGGVFEKNVTNGDSGDEGISASITGGLFKAEVQNEAASAAITGGVFVTKPTGSGTIANGYTLTTSGKTSKFVYAANGKEIDLGQSVYVIPNNTDTLKVACDGVFNWDVADGSGTHALATWNGVTLKQDGSFALNPDKINGTTLTFTESTTPVTPDPELVLAGGVPDTSTEHAKQKTVGGKTIYYGNGWEYDDTTLKLNPTEAKTFELSQSGGFLKCKLEVGEKATVKGWIFLSRPVENHGVIDGPKFHTEGGGYSGYPNLTNYGTVKNCYVDYGYVTNNGTMENVSFLVCKSLTNNAGAKLVNVVIAKDTRRDFSFSNKNGTIDKAIFNYDAKLPNARIVKEARGKRIVASVDTCNDYVGGIQLYVVGKPTLKIKIDDDDNTTITDVNSNTSYGNLTPEKTAGYQQFTVQSGNGDIVLNQIGAPDPSEVKHTLTLVNAELVGMTGTEFTENTTIKIKPKFDGEEFELDCWASEPTDFDVSSIYANGDGTYTLKMPGNALTLTANGRKKTYSLTVVNGYIGDATDIRSGSFEKGAQITLTQKVPEDKEFTGWELSDGLTPVDGYELTNTTIKVTMPGNAATAKATYKDKAPTTYTLTVDGGYIGDDETKASGDYEAGATIKLTAKAKTGYHFTKWTVEEGTLSLSEEKLKANPLTFEMPDGAVSLKANYGEDTPDPVDPNPTPNPDDQPKTYTVTVKGGKINGETKVEGIAKGTKLTVDVDETEVPEGMTFDVWSIRFPEGINDTLTGDPSVMLHDPHMAFAMPEADITIEAQYRSSELPGEDDGPSTLGTMATVAVGGAAAGILVWQGVSLGVDSYLQLNLPKGVAVPANRRELVVLLWETAGKPEAALPSLYSDVPAEEIELQKAIRWAIDNGLVKPADDSDASRFDPDRYVTKYDVFGAWLKLKKLMK